MEPTEVILRCANALSAKAVNRGYGIGLNKGN